MNKEKIARGQQAKRILDMPEFQEITNEVRKDLFDQFRKTNVSNTEERERIHQIAYAFDLLDKQLQQYVSEAVFELNAAEQLDNLKDA
ncbi:hypothetical protein Brsp06_03498 [Brucella sp. NBRC 13694]|uniref:hypothetical protein n=1 Tax=Brucella sp. NBRC 13694 TaxID=3075482 RepID=UPI0030A0405C